MSETDVRESVGVWPNFFFSGGTKPNKGEFLGSAFKP